MMATLEASCYIAERCWWGSLFSHLPPSSRSTVGITSGPMWDNLQEKRESGISQASIHCPQLLQRAASHLIPGTNTHMTGVQKCNTYKVYVIDK
ncbi:hypothetical protein INR49_003893, partial [Caranx melampygus]